MRITFILSELVGFTFVVIRGDFVIRIMLLCRVTGASRIARSFVYIVIFILAFIVTAFIVTLTLILILIIVVVCHCCREL